MENFPWLESVKVSLSEALNVHVHITALNSIGGSSLNSTGLLETNQGDFFIKWNSTGPEDIFATEAFALKTLIKAQTRLVIPKPICFGKTDSLKYLVVEYLKFVPSDSTHQEELGRGLAELHQNSYDQFGFYQNNYCGLTSQRNDWKDTWGEFYTENRLGYLWQLIQAERPFTPQEEATFSKAKLNIKEAIQDLEKPSLIHGDLWSGNSENTPLGPALFDPALYYGHREAELGMMFLFGGFSALTLNAYEKVYPLRKGWKERLKIYQLYHLLNHHLLFGGGYGAQALEILREWE